MRTLAPAAARGTAARACAAGAPGPRDPRDDRGRREDPGEDRRREGRCISRAPGSQPARLVENSGRRPMTPDEYTQQKAAASGSSFYYSFLFLPPEKRRAITALYAFCREVDDVVDEVSDVGIARTKLAWWRTEVANLFAGHPQHPVTKALAPFIESTGLDAARLNEIIDGMEMDLTYHRYPDF